LTIRTFSASRKNGSASWTARRASRTSFQATATRLGNSPGPKCRYATRHDQNRPAGLEDKAAGIESPKRIPARGGIANDDEIGRPRLARDHIGLRPHDGSPFHAPAARPDGSVKLLPSFVE